ncbi:MAG TPA: MYXO-CTERM sorting domain-containing protein [Polyangia bacterium]|jgi:hypothetical protein|nr:MYXO-CTERM sorting domain-containing protein [Polyangia bacterium]
MSSSGKKLGWSLIAGLCLLLSGRAFAAPNPTSCINDVDCMATPTCGGEVCDFTGTGKCIAADATKHPMDGWCTSSHGDDDCKCKGQGAKCVGFYCTFTLPSQAPAGTGGASAGTGGSSAGTGGTSGSTDGGTSSSGSSGCSVAGGAPAGLSLIAGLGLIGFAVRRRSRRR